MRPGLALDSKTTPNMIRGCSAKPILQRDLWNSASTGVNVPAKFTYISTASGYGDNTSMQELLGQRNGSDFLLDSQKNSRGRMEEDKRPHHRLSGIISNPIVAMTASMAPNRNGAAGPYQSQSNPAIMLAGKAATPNAALKIP